MKNIAIYTIHAVILMNTNYVACINMILQFA